MKKCLTALACLLCTSSMLYSQNTWQFISGVPTMPRIDDIYFVNGSTGFVGANEINSKGIYKTTDKGDTWNLISPIANDFGHIRSIEFINDSIGFFGLVQTTDDSTSLYKTTNGGITWSAITNMQMQLFDGICGLSHYGNSIIGVGTFTTPAWFYRSDDLGVTWTKMDMSAWATGLVDCYMVSSDTILVSGIGDVATQSKATILKSVDGGLTWQRVFLSATPTSYCWKMFLRPDGLGLASVELGSSVARTTDYGTTWTEIALNTSFSFDLGAVGLLNDTLGWITSQSNIGYTATCETHDGGLTWDSVTTVIEAGDRMVVVDSVTALIAGRGIYKYRVNSTSVAPMPAAAKAPHSLNIYPNPTNDYLHINAVATNQTFGLIDIMDQKGIMVKHVTRQLFKKGENAFNISTKELAAGTYKALWRNNERFLIESFVKK